MWGKIDDRDHGDPAKRRAFARSRSSLGLFYLAESWSSAYGTDGRIEGYYIDSVIPDPQERLEAVEALLDAGLWEALGDGAFVSVGFTARNPSAAQIKRRREQKRAAGREGARRRWDSD